MAFLQALGHFIAIAEDGIRSFFDMHGLLSLF